jgi:hypothetical protein
MVRDRLIKIAVRSFDRETERGQEHEVKGDVDYSQEGRLNPVSANHIIFFLFNFAWMPRSNFYRPSAQEFMSFCGLSCVLELMVLD